MKFYHANSDKKFKCIFCKCNILREQNYVIENYESIKRSFVFHADIEFSCYLKWKENSYRNQLNKWWDSHKKASIKMGRPIIHTETTNAVKINRLKTCINYHKKLGHEDKVRLLEIKLRSIGQKLGVINPK